MNDDDYTEDLRDWYSEDEPLEQFDPPICDLPNQDYGREFMTAPPSEPFTVARFVNRLFRAHGARTLLAWRGDWMYWRATHWIELDTAQLRSHIYHTLQKATFEHETKDGIEVKPWRPDKRKVANVLEALEALTYVASDIDPPAWISLHSAAENDAGQVISCENGLLDLTARTMFDHTPALFNVVSVPFAYQENADPPEEWLTFLNSVWPDDSQSILLLQEYIGYVLSGRTDMQKALLLIGPTRSGKGTIARMLVQLIGRGHVAGPTLASLGTNFGLSPLLGRPLAIISDARLGNIPTHTIVERLLSITGEDMLTIDRKYKEPWSGKLPTRFVILSNELPRFRDSSMAIANRLLVLQMTESFLGREDRELDDKLRPELAGILSWALVGLDRLVRNGRFTTPGSSEDATSLMMDLASPMSAFVRDCCERDVDASVGCDDLYHAWKTWAEENGHRAGAKSTFGRDLRAVVPELRVERPRDGGRQVRYYTRIGLECCTRNRFYPDSPDSVDETAGQDTDGESGSGGSSCLSGDSAAHSESGSRAYPDSPGGVNTQVNDGETGETGKTQLWAEHRADESANAAYLNGLCRDGCGNPHAPGKPRCDACHRIWQTTLDRYDR